MHDARGSEVNHLPPRAPAFLPPLLAVTPLLDVTRLVTTDGRWMRAATWSALAATVAVAAVVAVELAAWLATAPHSAARRDGAAPMMLHLAALWPLALGVVERVHALGSLSAPRVAFLWPFALAVAGAAAWIVGDWTAESARDARYQPTGLPSRA